MLCKQGTLASFAEKRLRDFEEITVYAVDGNFKEVGPEWEFLTDPVNPFEHRLRTVLFIPSYAVKGTARNIEEWSPILYTLSGPDYSRKSFGYVLNKLYDRF